MSRDAYFFTITNTKKFYYTLFANGIQLIFFVLFAIVQYNAYHNSQSGIWMGLLLPCFLLVIFCIRLFFILTRKHLQFSNLHYSILAGLCMVFLHFWIPAFMILLLGILEYWINRDRDCILDQQGIRITGFPPKNFPWKALSNVVVKDGIFTIDQKNNHILQLDISKEILPFSEKEVQQFIADKMLTAAD